MYVSICSQPGWGLSSNHRSRMGSSESGSNISRERAVLLPPFWWLEDGVVDCSSLTERVLLAKMLLFIIFF